MGAIKGDSGIVRPEQRIHGGTAGSWGCMGAIHDTSTIPCVECSRRSCVRACAWLLVMFVTSLEKQSMGAWLVWSMGSLLANGEKWVVVACRL